MTISFTSLHRGRLVFWLLTFLGLFVLGGTVFAQTEGDMEEKARQYGITFPIAELGNCANYSECRNYCEDPVNANTCISFARSKGFYQDEADEKVGGVLSRAKRELGCDSRESCQNFCEIAANFDKCSSFAQNQGLGGGYVHDPAERGIAERAKDVLGCDSPDSCRSFCEQEANRDKCTEFAKTAGLRGGERPIGPGGCTSEETCKAFCSDPGNYQICAGFHSSSGSSGTFSGPGGCNSEESCRAYCQQNESECRSFGGAGASPPPGYNPQEMCNRTPNCAWKGNTCECGFYGETVESQERAGEYQAFCQANPDKCKPGQPSSFESSQERQEFEDFCRKYPDKCQPPTTPTTGTSGYYGAPDPATDCAKYGCSWTGSSCQCTGVQYTQPQPATGGTYDPATECGKTSGCSWTGTSCQCGGTYTQPSGESQPSSYTPPPDYNYSQPSGGYTAPTYESAPQPSYESAPPPPPSTESTPPPSGVYGMATGRGFLQMILDFVFGR